MTYFLFIKPTCLIIYIIIIINVNCDNNNNTKSIAELYEKGVQSYLENNFQDCVSYLEKSLINYRYYSNVIKNCRLNCKKEVENDEPLYKFDIENLLFFEKTIKNTLCLIKCKSEYDDKYNLDTEIEDVFEKLKPYEYLHICYFQIKDLQKATSSVFTYLMLHPDDKTMRSTLKYYSTFDEVNVNDIVNFEAKDYVYLYSKGCEAYEEKKWKTVIENMEESLEDFLQSENECRALCEGSFDHGWLPDFIPSIANHFTHCLSCKNKCYSNLNSINGEKYEDLLPSHYHYLQYAYYKDGDMKKSCQAVSSYLLFYPNDTTMLDNVKYYSKLEGVEKDFFTPREEAVNYIRRQIYEKKILKFIEKEFNFDHEKKNNEVTKNIKVKKLEKNRYVFDGILTKNQCRIMIDIIKKFSIIGDGYDFNISPHTKMEKFEGVNLERLIYLNYFGLINNNYLKLILDITEDIKEIIKERLSIEKKLYFTYSHLVCRTSLEDLPKNLDYLSHDIHSDNCNIHPNGTCDKLPPSYGWRDYSAIVYLNNNFQGGEFFFSSNMSKNSIESTITPTCGKMVAFSSENLHGVKAVGKGSRCVLALWFTFDENHKEKERDIAYDLLKMKNFL